MISRIPLILLLLIAAFPSYSADGIIYKCVDRSGHQTFQNEPCQSPEQTKATRSYVDPGYNPELARKVEEDARAVERRKAQRAASGGYRLGWPSPASGGASACQQARRSRDEALQQAGFSSTYDMRRALDEMVFEACKSQNGIR